MQLTWIAVLDHGIAVLATIRLMGFFMQDDLGRRPMRWIEERVRLRLPSHRGWIADGFTCPFCLGFWIGLAVILSLMLATDVGGVWLTGWRAIAGALALNYVAAHVMITLDAYDGPDDGEDDYGNPQHSEDPAHEGDTPDADSGSGTTDRKEDLRTDPHDPRGGMAV